MPASASAASSIVLSTGRSTTTASRAAPPRGNSTARAIVPRSTRPVKPARDTHFGSWCSGTSATDTSGYRLASADCRRWMMSACSEGAARSISNIVVRPNTLACSVRWATRFVDEIRADVEEDEQKGQQRKSDEQQNGDRADQDIGQDQLAADPPEQTRARKRGDAIDRDDDEDDEREIDRAIDRDVARSGKPHQHLERDRGDPESRNGANDITRPSTLESSSGTPRCRRRSASR